MWLECVILMGVLHDTRVSRLKVVKSMLKEKDREKTIAKLCLMWGCSRRTVQEYIKVVELGS